MQIDEGDIAELKRLDSIAESRVNAYIATNPELFHKLMAYGNTADEVRRELTQSTIESLHFKYWGMR